MGFRVHQNALFGTARVRYHSFDLCCRLIRLRIFTFKGFCCRFLFLHHVALLPYRFVISGLKASNSHPPFRTIRQSEEAAFRSPTPGGEGKAIIPKMGIKIHGEYGKNPCPQDPSIPYKSTPLSYTHFVRFLSTGIKPCPALICHFACRNSDLKEYCIHLVPMLAMIVSIAARFVGDSF